LLLKYRCQDWDRCSLPVNPLAYDEYSYPLGGKPRVLDKKSTTDIKKTFTEGKFKVASSGSGSRLPPRIELLQKMQNHPPCSGFLLLNQS
jgi:hypothetical protein